MARCTGLDVDCMGCDVSFFSIWNNLLWIWNSLEKWYRNLAIIFAAWELGMAFVTILTGGRLINSLHVCNWMGDDYCRCWSCYRMAGQLAINRNRSLGRWTRRRKLVREVAFIPLPGAEPLSVFSGSPNLGVSNWLAFVISTIVLIFRESWHGLSVKQYSKERK